MLRSLALSALLFGSVASLRAQIVINEVMSSPTAPEPEWVELYNSGTSAVTVTGWTVHDGSTTVGTLPAATIQGGAFLVLLRDSNTLRIARGSQVDGIAMVETTLPSLNNTGDLVVLHDPSGTTIDSLNYRASWGGTSGVSLERARADRGNDSTNWRSSVDPTNGTPGRANSITPPGLDLAVEGVLFDPGTSQANVAVLNAGVRSVSAGIIILFFDANGDSIADGSEEIARETVTALDPEARDTVHLVWSRPLTDGGEPGIVLASLSGDERRSNDTARFTARATQLDTGVVINEIMFDPLPAGDLSGAEYVELHNLNNRPVTLDGWTIIDGTGKPQATVPSGAHVLQANGYIALVSDTTIYARFPALRDSPNVVILHRPSLGLNSDEDDVVLRNVRGATVDSVHYKSSWHRSTLGETRGFSLERISVASGSNDERNWSTSAAPLGGTPGERNSLEITPTTSDAELTVAPATVSPDGDGFEDFTRASWKLPTNTARITAIVYDRNGRVVRRLANNEPAAAEGEIIWDGLNDEGRTPGIGPYIIRVEAYDDAGGGVSAAQAVVVVAKKL